MLQNCLQAQTIAHLPHRVEETQDLGSTYKLIYTRTN